MLISLGLRKRRKLAKKKEEKDVSQSNKCERRNIKMDGFLDYLIDCMTIAVKTAIGAGLWAGIIILIVSIIAIATFLFSKKKDDEWHV
jgi:hypothetical protein